MVETTSGMVAPVARRRKLLLEKAETRDHKKMVKRLPAGSGGALRAVPKGKEFSTTAKDGKRHTNVSAYCEAVRKSTDTFKDGHRATSTAMEHDDYMIRTNNWAERSGFGTYVLRREGVAREDPPCVMAARDETTRLPKVLAPEMIVGMMLEMATGDENMPKGGHPDDLQAMASRDDKNICGPRTEWKREKGETGYGAYKDEPWHIQAFEKRIYAIRDFYKRELRGTELEDPGWDSLVVGVLAALVLLIGRKPMHVPQVRDAN